jgi:hypothetical protein
VCSMSLSVFQIVCAVYRCVYIRVCAFVMMYWIATYSSPSAVIHSAKSGPPLHMQPEP